MDHVLSQEQQSGHRFQSVNVDVPKISLAKNHTEKLKKPNITKNGPFIFVTNDCINERFFLLLSSATVNVHLDIRKVFMAMFISLQTKINRYTLVDAV